MSKRPAAKAPAHTGGWGGLGNTKFPGGAKGGGGGGHQPKARQHHKRARQHKHTGGFGGLGNIKFPGAAAGHPKAARHPKKPKHPKRHLAGPSLGGWWITGGNDAVDNCAAVAVANSLLLATGHRVSDAELLRLHDRAGPLSIPEALAAFSFRERPPGRRVRPAVPDYTTLAKPQLWERDSNPASASQASGVLPGLSHLILGLDTPHGPHAALIYGDALITWGGVMDWPDDWDLEEAWSVTWPP